MTMNRIAAVAAFVQRIVNIQEPRSAEVKAIIAEVLAAGLGVEVEAEFRAELRRQDDAIKRAEAEILERFDAANDHRMPC